MLLFSQRLFLEEAFNKWADYVGASKRPASVISWLESFGMIDEKSVIKWLKREGYKE